MVTETGDAAREPHSLPADLGETALFCGYDPLWVNLPIRLKGWINTDYGGITLFGPCPRCTHGDGINLFIPTTWATASAAAAPGLAVVRAAFVHPTAIGAEVEVEWQPPGTTAATGPDAQQQEIVEVIVCRCGKDFKHKPPSGKAGCGYWTCLRLWKETIPDGH